VRPENQCEEDKHSGIQRRKEVKEGRNMEYEGSNNTNNEGTKLSGGNSG
jgi:hypothetical protein